MNILRTLSLVAITSLAMPTLARAQGAPEPSAAARDANIHFMRGVALYGEADYKGALVEFRRAMEILPSPLVLYNIGQTHYQLQNYAESLVAFERYLNEAGAKATHRADVQSSIALLKTRVGRIDVASNVPGSEVAIDDEVSGKTPLPAPITVSLGRRKVRVSAPGYQTMDRNVDVAAGDTVPLVVTLERLGQAPSGPTGGAPARVDDTKALRTIGWIATGVLGAAAITTGVLALGSAGRLSDARNAFPGSKSDIDSKSSQTLALSITSDVLGALTIVTAGVTIYLTLSAPRDPQPRVGLLSTPVHPSLGGFQLRGEF